ncbi:MAG: hypothetical protein ACRENH_00220, partial [Gemmatimonadaceae bacterium]
MRDDSQSDDQVPELGSLSNEVAPDSAVQERTIAALRARSLLRQQGVRAVGLRPWLALAAVAVVAFWFGLKVGRPDAPAAAPQPSFALMLYGGSTGGDSSAHAMRAAEYRRWSSAKHPWGRVIGGEALGDSAWTVSQAKGGVSLSKPRADDLVGFFLIQAPSREAAAFLASECPHLKYGGRVVVR